MGAVWVAHHEALDADVAVKFVTAEVAERDGSAIARFKREAALSAKIKSPHGVKTFDHGVMDDGRPYIVMELLHGETLGHRLQRTGSLTGRDVSIIVGQIAQVLEEAHRLGVVHRDIKPDNVFLIESGYDVFVKVLDFGIAKQTAAPHVSQVTEAGAIVGTPEYMSPEQLLGTAGSEFGADHWALAVLAYHCLTGRVPFGGETFPSLSLSICSGRFDPPSAIVAELSEDLDDWFRAALDPDPELRFDSVIEMSNAFRRIVRGSKSVSVPPRSDAEPGARGGDTLRSARPNDEPPAPRQLGALDDEPGDSGVRQSVGPADADQSGRRVAVTDTLASGTSPTFSGSASNLAPDERDDRWRARRKLIALLAVAVMLAAAADMALRRAGPSVAGSVEPAALTTAPTTTTREPRAGASPPPALASSTASPSAAADPSPPATTPDAGAPRPPPSPRPRPSSASPSATPRASDPCANPYIVQPDGTLKIKPRCL
jgi:serine/threonine-protein kinase